MVFKLAWGHTLFEDVDGEDFCLEPPLSPRSCLSVSRSLSLSRSLLAILSSPSSGLVEDSVVGI